VVNRGGRAAEQQGEAALVAHVSEAIRRGVLAPGDSLPSLRELGARFGMTRDAAHAALKPMINAGRLEARPRSGLFVAATARTAAGACFVMTSRPPASWTRHPAHSPTVSHGFERQIALRGGLSLHWTSEDPLPVVPAGVFRFSAPAPTGTADLPQVLFSDAPVPEAADAPLDRVLFDDVAGGRDATRHLLDRGYRRIAFLGRHFTDAASLHNWAVGREDGWRAALGEAQPLAFHATDAELALRGVEGAAYDIARAVAARAVDRRVDYDAVVGVDDVAVEAYLAVWRDRGLPEEALPALVGFEDLPEVRCPSVTSLRPPWEQLGAVAADLLWQRVVGHVTGPPVTRLVAMDLAARLSTPVR